ncbi:DUF3617 domain-containing protein [Candidatus Deferrimicrobium sp.]|uniref:DUF3617 domain-containing protein n=1 Tax=Candidatus Deferrimicrobium sp. TaxID=3060586 RepID=UPI003C33694B
MIVATATALLVSTLLCGAAVADDLPALRQGLWNFQRTVNGKKIESTKCTSPTEDMKKMSAKLEKSGCRLSPVKKSGNVYTYTADCSLKMPKGATLNSRSTSVLTVESDSSYRLEVNAVTDGQASKERLVAKRIGDCPK